MTTSIATSSVKSYVPNVCIHHGSDAFFTLLRCLVDIASPGWDASLSDHVLKNIRATDAGFSEKGGPIDELLLVSAITNCEFHRESIDPRPSAIVDRIRSL